MKSMTLLSNKRFSCQINAHTPFILLQRTLPKNVNAAYLAACYQIPFTNDIRYFN